MPPKHGSEDATATVAPRPDAAETETAESPETESGAAESDDETGAAETETADPQAELREWLEHRLNGLDNALKQLAPKPAPAGRRAATPRTVRVEAPDPEPEPEPEPAPDPTSRPSRRMARTRRLTWTR